MRLNDDIQNFLRGVIAGLPIYKEVVEHIKESCTVSTDGTMNFKKGFL